MTNSGYRFTIEWVFEKYTEEEIKEKLDEEFNLNIAGSEDFNSKIVENESRGNLKSEYPYKIQIHDLITIFELKKQNTYELIEMCFPSPQMTNTKFKDIVDECSKMFYHKTDNLLLIINSSQEYSVKLEDEIKSDISTLKEINNKLDSLNEELLLNMSNIDDENDETI